MEDEKSYTDPSMMRQSCQTNVGGQAVLEGVMMRSPNCFAVAVRRKGGRIIVREQPWEGALAKKLAKVPFVRGAVTLVESLRNGYAALLFSAEQFEEDIAEEEAAKEASKEAGPGVTYRTPATERNKGGGASGAGARLANVVAVLLFIAIPQLLAFLFGKLFGPGIGLQDFAFHALTGVFKLALVLGYLLLIRRIPEVRRVFQYHGAEHKAIATYEAGEPLTVEYAKKHSTRHARCGTTFLIVVVLVSVLVYAAVLPVLLKGWEGASAQGLAIVLKLLMMPFIAGLAYELQRLGARFSETAVAKLFLTPGFWVQGITTIEPSDDQLEIALASLRLTLVREEEQRTGAGTKVSEPVVREYASFDEFARHYGGIDAKFA